MYKSIIIGTETNTELINKQSEITTKHSPKKIKRISFPFHPNELNFNANISIGAFRRQLNSKIITIIKYLNVSETLKDCVTNVVLSPSKFSKIKPSGIKTKNNAFAGVGNPINLSD